MGHRGQAAVSAGLGVLAVGSCGGMLMAVVVMLHKFAESKIEYTGELTGVSYVMLAGVVGVLIVGLGWCLYRAVRAAGAEAPPPQRAEALDED